MADPDRSALDKFDAVFSGLASFKADRKELILELMRVWLSDDNAVVREHFRRGVIAAMTPLLATIIRQGVTVGSFATASPDHAARVFASLLMGPTRPPPSCSPPTTTAPSPSRRSNAR